MRKTTKKPAKGLASVRASRTDKGPNLISRNITESLETLALNRHKMAFISGPRQCGKTTLAKQLITNANYYFNWDQVTFKRQWQRDPSQIAEVALSEPNPIIAIDEFHKNQQWKNQIKGFYDEFGDKIKIIVTGSAHLNIYRKGVDSLLGRFLHFNLLPLSSSEILGRKIFTYSQFKSWIAKPNPNTLTKETQSTVEALFKFGGFPEPFLAQSEQIQNIWSKDRLELLIRQDLRDLSHLLNLNQIEVLASFLPERVGSPLSKQSLVEDLDVAHTTLTRWLAALNSVYYHYEVKPFVNGITRSLKKEGKLFLYDWCAVESDGPRFENFVGSQLLKLINYYNDTGQGDLRLHYLRDKEKNEVDFVIANKQSPLFSVEVKLNELNLDPTFKVFQKKLKVPHFQIVLRPGIFRKFNADSGDAYVISAASFFEHLP